MLVKEIIQQVKATAKIKQSIIATARSNANYSFGFASCGFRTNVMLCLTVSDVFFKKVNNVMSQYVNIIRPFYADTFKGSYFANPLFDVPTTDDVLLTRYNA